MKRLLSFLVALFLATTALLAYDFKEGYLCYNILEDGRYYKTVAVTYERQKNYLNYAGLTSVNIPSEVIYKGTAYTVTSIGNDAFYGCTYLTSITIPNSVKSIGNDAFYGCTYLTSITIPNSVKSIEERTFYGCIGLTSVTIGNSVTSIGYRAFYGCSGLTSVTIPNSVTSIGESAFSGCTGLTSITIPESVTSIGKEAFSGCTGLTSITIPNSVTSIGSRAFSGCTGLTSITIPNSITSIESSTFSGCTGLTSVTIGNSATSIGKEAFSGCTSLASITIPNRVTSIGESAFSGCTGLTSVTIPNSVTSIGYSAFSGCTGLTSVTIPNSVTSIGYSAFSGCTGLTSVTIPNSVKSIGSRTFSGCTGLTSVTIPNSVTNIEWYAFSGCTSLTSVTIPNSVTSIGVDAFENVPNIVYEGTATGSPWGAKSVNGYVEGYFVYKDETKTALLVCSSTATGAVTIPNSVTSIEKEAFLGCIGLTSVTIGNSVTSIGYRAFYGCSGLTSVIIPNSLTSIGEQAFSGCTGLTSVTIPNNVTSIGWGAFKNVPNIIYDGTATGTPWGAKSVNGYVEGYFVYKDATKAALLVCSSTATGAITIPNSVTSIGKSAFEYCTGLTSITIPNSVTSIGEGAFEYCTGLTFITIPNSVTSIGEDAFRGCTGLTSITIPNGITSIESGTFFGCIGLTSVTIPNSVTTIGSSTFYSCTGLTSITIPNSVTSIGYSAFSGCMGLTSITIPNSVTSIGSSTFSGCMGLTSITIPNSVTTIKYEAFYKCTSLTSVTIGNGVTTIGDDAFYMCTSLKKVNYKGDVQGWLDITFEDLESNPIYYSRNLYINDVLLTKLVIPDGVTNISSRAFAYDECLTSVTIPNSVTSIGGYAFSGCTGLASATIGNGVTSIGEEAFYGYTGIVINNLPRNLRSIGSGAFDGCKIASTIIIPDSVTSIGYDAFDDKNLKQVTCLPKTPPTIGTVSQYVLPRAFGNNTSLELIVPAQSLEAYKASDFDYYHITTHGLSAIDEKVTQTTIKIDAVPAVIDSTQFAKVGYVFNGDSVWFENTDTIHIERNNLLCDTEYGISLFATSQDSSTTLYSTTLRTLPIRFDLKNVVSQQATVTMRTICAFGDIPFKQYGIQIAKGEDSEQYDTIVVIDGRNNIDSIVQIKGLAPGTVYKMRGFCESSVKMFDGSSNSKTATYYTSPVTFATKPVIVTNPTLTQYGQTYMLLATSSNYGDATLVEEAVEYGTSQSETQIASVSNNMVKINNLFPDTRYYYRSLLTTAEGGTIYSDWQEMTTKAITLSTGEADGISAKSVFLHGTIDCDMESRTEIGFEWKRSDAPATLKPQRVLVTDRADSTLVFRLEGLDKDKYYDYRAFCLYKEQTYYGKAEDGREWVTFLTALEDVLVAPSVQTLGAETSEAGVVLSGFVVAGTENIIQKGFESWRKGTTDVATTVSEGAVMTNEIPEPWSYTTYQYRAYAKTPSGTTYGETREVTTGYIHKEITDVVVTPSATTATVTWTIVEQANYYILTLFGNAGMTDTLVTYTVDEAGNITQRRAPAALRAMVNCSIDQLTPDTDYFFTVIAYNADEKKVAEENGTFTTTQPTTDLGNIEDTDPNGDNRNGDTLNGNGTTATTVRKVFRNGQVYILRDGKTYTTTGVEVK